VRHGLLAGLPLIAASAGGCSISFVDAEGVQNHVGLMWVRHSTEPEPIVVQTRKLGVGLELGLSGGGFLAGYQDVVRVTPGGPDADYELSYTTARPFAARVTDHRGQAREAPEPDRPID